MSSINLYKIENSKIDEFERTGTTKVNREKRACGNSL